MMLQESSTSRSGPLLPTSDPGNSARTIRVDEPAQGRESTGVHHLLAIVAVLVAWVALVWWLVSASGNDPAAFVKAYASIPVVDGIVGWGTNVVALIMTFYPLEFFGCFPQARLCDMPLCGWQGIIPSKCTKMAAMAVDLMTTRLIDVREVFSRLDPKKVAQHLHAPLEVLTPQMLDKLGMERAPAVWGKLPDAVKNEIAIKCLEDAPNAINDMMEEIKTNITTVFDLKDMVVSMFERDKQLTNDIFLKCGAKEFTFIRISGFYLGFLFGLFQMGLWKVLQQWWTLPVAGFAVGYLTNYIALKIIFQPIQPKRVCGITVQGLFLQRQEEVSVVYAEMISQKVLNSENLLNAMIVGSCSNKLFDVMDKHIMKGIDKVVQNATLARMVVGSEEYTKMKKQVCELLRSDMKAFFPHLTPYTEEALNIRETLQTSMRALSSEDFEGLLHPCFQEDELKLIVVGGLLGALVGLIQAILQVPDQLGITGCAWC